MKKVPWTKALCFLLSLPLSLSAVCAIPSSAGGQEGEGLEAFLSGFPLGEEVYSFVPAREKLSALPEGWSTDAGKYTFLWQYNLANITKAHVTSRGYEERVLNAAHITTLPDVAGDQYVFSATYHFNSAAGSFGLATDVHEYQSANEFYFYGSTGKGRSEARGTGGVLKDTDAFAPIPVTPGTDITVTAVHVHDVTYQFVNGRYYFSLPDRADADGRIGFYNCGADVTVTAVRVQRIDLDPTLAALRVTDCSVRSADASGSLEGPGACGLRFTVTVDKTDPEIASRIGSSYEYSEEGTVRFGAFLLPTDLLGGAELGHATEGAVRVVAEKIASQTPTEMTYVAALVGIPGDQLARSYTVRPFMEVTEGGAVKTYVSKTQNSRVPYIVADAEYAGRTPEVRRRLAALFGGIPEFQGDSATSVKFVLFSDFHYKEGMYATTADDLRAVLARAAESGAGLVLHAGDFCNDYKGSPEIIEREYLNNPAGLPVYGVYGNHELETSGNTMSVVSPLLTNRAGEVVWGTWDGKPRADGSVGYYCFDRDGFRFIMTDTNYSWNPTEKKWEHNHPATSSPPSTNTHVNSLGDVQLAWLEKTLTDAAEKGLHCILVGHNSLSGIRSSVYEVEAVQKLFARVNGLRPGTVMMCINGHYHTDHLDVANGILYMDVNTTRNGYWERRTDTHYAPGKGQTFPFVSYDAQGAPVGMLARELSTLTQAANTWFFTDPLCAVVTVDSCGNIVVEGARTGWMYGITPPNEKGGTHPWISDGEFHLFR